MQHMAYRQDYDNNHHQSVQGASIFSLDFSEISIKVASAFHYVLICFGMTSLTSFPDGVLCCFVDPQIQSGLTFDISSFFSTQIFSNFSPPPQRLALPPRKDRNGSDGCCTQTACARGCAL